jgi:hypothetical protein
LQTREPGRGGSKRGYAPGELHLFLSLISGDDPSINQEVMDGREKAA